MDTATRTLLASIRDTLMEVRHEIGVRNRTAGAVFFNPATTQLVDSSWREVLAALDGPCCDAPAEDDDAAVERHIADCAREGAEADARWYAEHERDI